MASKKVNMKKFKLFRLKDVKTGQENSGVAQTVRPSGIKLSVVSGRIEKEETDVIINSISASLNVDHGVLTSAVSARAGPGLQAALLDHQGPVHYGDVLRTPGFKLKAKAVYHVVVAGFNYPDAGDILENLLARCFELAEHDKWTSISIPALGTGRHSFPPFVMAHRTVEAIRRYEEKCGNKTKIKKIKFVCNEQRNIHAFQNALGEVPTPSQRAVTDKVKSIKKLSMRLKKPASPSEVKTSFETDDDSEYVSMGPGTYAAHKSLQGAQSLDYGGESLSDSSASQASTDVPPPLPPSWNKQRNGVEYSSSSPSRGAAKKPSTLNIHMPDVLVKALHKSKAYKKEQYINQLRSYYRELPQPPRRIMPWRHVITTKKAVTTSTDLDDLIDALVGTEAHRKRKPVLLHGQSYVGKSTVIHRIARLWAEGELTHIRLVVLVNLQTLISLSDKGRAPTLRECVRHCLQLAGIGADEVPEVVAPSRGKFLLLLDDVEAWAMHFTAEIPLDSLFSKAHIIATSRTPTAMKLADAYSPILTVELKGFCPDLLRQYLSTKTKQFVTNEGLVDAAEKLYQFSKALRYKNMLHPPGWIEKALQVLTLSKGASTDVESLMRYGPLMQKFIEIQEDFKGLERNEELAGFGEALLRFLSQKHSKILQHKPRNVDVFHKGACRRWILDYAIAVYINHELGRKGKVHHLNAVSLEGVYRIQTSLEIACGLSAGTSQYVHWMIEETAREDTDVFDARQHVLDGSDQASLRVLKRLHDLQAGCLRQSDTRLREDADVPDELQYLGAEYSRVYLLACEQGTKEMRHTRVMIVGHFGAGKTSLKRCLVKEKFNPEYNVTNGIDADVAACRIQVDSTCNWNLIERAMESANTDEHSREVARLLFDFLMRMKDTSLPVVEEEDPQTPDMDLTNTTPMFEVPNALDEDFDEIDGPPGQLEVSSIKSGNSSASSSGSQNVMLEHSTSMNLLVEAMGKAGLSDADDMVRSLPPAVIEALKNLLRGNHEQTTSKESEVKLSFWDFAGQQVFYTTHQTFLSHRGIYMLVLDLTKDLNHRIETLRQSRHGKVVDKACPQTVGEYLDYWLNCIHTHAQKDSQQDNLAVPPVIIVCTHKDVIEEKYGPEEAEKKVREYFRSIQKHIDKKAYAEHVYHTFFAVANCREGDAVIADLRRTIVTIATKQPYWAEKIPLKWLDLRKKLGEIQALDGSVVSLKKVTELAGDAGINNTDEVKTLLMFYHALGELVFFNEEGLRDFIVLDPQWLIDNFRKVITVSKFHKQDVFPNSRLHWSNLDDYGFLHDKVLESVWDRDTKDELVAIMKKFNLIVPVVHDYEPDENFHVPEINGNGSDGPRYLVPCMLPQVSEDDLPSLSENDPCALLLIFQEGFVPVGLFHRLLATCSNQLNWQFFGTVYHDFTSFFVDESEEVEISLRALKASIEIRARCMTADEPGFKVENYSELLRQCLSSVTTQLYSLIRTVSPTQHFYVGMKCTCKTAKEAALINLEKMNTENFKKRIKCARHKATFLAKGVQPWFKPMKPPEIKVEEMTFTSLPTYSDLDQSLLPTEKQLADLSNEVGFEWDKLALYLNLSSAQVQRLTMDYPHSSQTRILKMFLLWRKVASQLPVERRFHSLTEALRQCQRTDLAEKAAQWQMAGKNLNLDD